MDLTPIPLQQKNDVDEQKSSGPDIDEYEPEVPGQGFDESQVAFKEKKENTSTSSSPTDELGPETTATPAPAESDEEYDPESINPSPEPEAQASASLKSPGTPSDDDYDPENGPEIPLSEKSSDKSPAVSDEKAVNKPVLPAKPNLPSKPTACAPSVAKDPQVQLKEAYEAIMKSDLVKRPEFKQLSQEEQMMLIDQQLKQRGITLPDINTPADPDMNYDQVYSYNKPSETKKLIPLVPQNKFCKRPNITLPMTPEEEKAYQKYLQAEKKYSDKKLLDSFPENSRLFIGNLSTNTLTKQDIFRICRPYGDVFHIMLKAGYGFVQFETAEQCAACIEGESGVPLHGRYIRLDASTSHRKLDEGQVRFRERTSERSHEAAMKRRDSPDCHIFITADSAQSLIEQTIEAFESAGLSLKIEDIGDQDLSEVIPDAAYSGVLGACVVKEENVDIQTFQETEDGGIRFDEYVALTPSVAVDLIKQMIPSSQTDEPNQKRFNTNDESIDSCAHESEQRKKRQRQNDRQKDHHDRYGRRNTNTHTSSRGGTSYAGSSAATYGVSPTPPAYSPQPPANAFQQPPNFQSYPQPYLSYSQNSAPQPAIDPQVLQILSSLDAATLQQVIHYIKQQQALGSLQQAPQQPITSGPSGGYGQYPMPQAPPPPPTVQSSSHLNTLLSQLQTPQQQHQNQSLPSRTQYSQPSQQPTHQQPGQSSMLMEMLSRFSKQ
ncbi:nuclear polyadenylated RNA-binding protein 3 [Candidozyma auris]|uniref:RRM domain-containing protein n=2 Tax=Candidozyma auris TaxID=498019 RepID=A0A2H0ZY10_CANAR|nr:hypothetical protein QG37_05321 [[Candida] auris]PIS55530.1 hypothetical protein B9J08_001632 [[Candida] auris]QWW22815.1 hypothetical protein CA7LBN_001562 [[Candida] auris]